MSGHFEYVKGNLFEWLDKPSVGSTIIAHVVNNQGIMGAGFALELMNRMPLFCAGYFNPETKLVLGDNIYENSGDCSLIVCHMVAQNGFPSRSNPRPTSYGDLAVCMENARCVAQDSCNIICPKFACGYGGCSWEIVKELIQSIWLKRGINVRVFEL